MFSPAPVFQTLEVFMIFKARNRDKNSSRTFWAETPSQVIKISDKFSYFYSVFCLHIPLLKNKSVLTNFGPEIKLNVLEIHRMRFSKETKLGKEWRQRSLTVLHSGIITPAQRARLREIMGPTAHTRIDRKSSKEQFSKPSNLFSWNTKTCV